MPNDSPVQEPTIENAAALLRAAGWIVAPPAAERPPEPEVGQVWISPKPRVEPRTVVKLGPGRGWSPDVPCVYFTSPSRPPDPKWGHSCMTREAWDAWVKKSGARPA